VIGKEFPNRVYLARWTELNRENLLDWFGPFPSSSDARRILKTLRPIFPFRSCTSLHKSPCLYFQLGLCPEVCIGKDKEEYKKTISALRRVLSAKTNVLDRITKSLEKQMKKASHNLQFEEAQSIKNKISSLRSLKEGFRTVPIERQEKSQTFLELRKLLTKYQGTDPITLNKIEGYDVSNLGKDIIVGSMVVFVEGEPENSLYRKFNLKYNLSDQNDPEGIKQTVRRRLNHLEWILPQLILVDGGKTQVSAAFEAIKEKELDGQIALLGIAKREEEIIVPKFVNGKIISWKTIRLSRRHPELQLLQSIRDESHRFAQRYYKEKHSQALKI
jgi:excinuclease ABC subunit C